MTLSPTLRKAQDVDRSVRASLRRSRPAHVAECHRHRTEGNGSGSRQGRRPWSPIHVTPSIGARIRDHDVNASVYGRRRDV